MQQNLGGLESFATSSAVSAPVNPYLRWKQNASDKSISLAGAFDEVLGVSQAFVNKAGDNVTLALRTCQGSRKIYSLSAVTVGQVLYGAAGGAVDTLGTNGLGTSGASIGPAEFIAIDSTTTAGVVEAVAVMPNGLGLLFAATADSAAVTGAVSTEQFFATTYTFNGPELRVGDVVKVRGRAVVTGKNAAETLIIKVYLGALVLVTSPTTNNAAADEVMFDLDLVITVIGASGKIQGFGVQVDGAPGTATLRQVSLASTTQDLTSASTVIRASATWSGSSAVNTVVLRDFIVELVRQ